MSDALDAERYRALVKLIPAFEETADIALAAANESLDRLPSPVVAPHRRSNKETEAK